MSKKEKDLAYYKKYVMIDLWVLFVFSIISIVLAVIAGALVGSAVGATGIGSLSAGVLTMFLFGGQIVLFIVCLILTKKEHKASGILNIVLAVLYIINFKLISILIGAIHLANSIGYQKHLSEENS